VQPLFPGRERWNAGSADGLEQFWPQVDPG